MVRTENPKDIIERFGVGQKIQKLTSKEFGVDKEPKVNLERVWGGQKPKVNLERVWGGQKPKVNLEIVWGGQKPKL